MLGVLLVLLALLLLHTLIAYALFAANTVLHLPLLVAHQYAQNEDYYNYGKENFQNRFVTGFELRVASYQF